MDFTAIILLVSFFVLLFLNVPISICIGLATLVSLVMHIDFATAAMKIA